MGRAYAGVLGYLAAALTLVRGAIAHGGVEGTLLSSIAALAIFAVLGFVLGTIAEATVDQAVRQRLEAQLDTIQTTEAS
jgi:VIT1/CCC1 family predicted Fe2+/Mn2+ transporter